MLSNTLRLSYMFCRPSISIEFTRRLVKPANRGVPFALLFLGSFLCFSCHADVDGCVPLQRAQERALLPRIKEVFAIARRLPLDQVTISHGRDCGSEVYFGVEAEPGAANVGSHWIVTMKKSSGEIEIVDGI